MNAETLRLELFPADLDGFHDFYTRVMRFAVERDDREASWPYIAVVRGAVRISASRAWAPTDATSRRPPQGVEIVFEVDDLEAERDAIVAEGWLLDQDVTEQPWGLHDLRVLDPDGHYLRITSR